MNYSINVRICLVLAASVPFKVGVEFGSDELTANAIDAADTVETTAFPAGIIGEFP